MPCSELDNDHYSEGTAFCKNECTKRDISACIVKPIGSITTIDVDTDYIFDGAKLAEDSYISDHISDFQKDKPAFTGSAGNYSFPHTTDGYKAWSSTILDSKKDRIIVGIK